MDKIPLEVQGEESAIRFRDCFSVRYIQSAALLCRLAFAIEQEYLKGGPVQADAQLRHEAFTLNAVLSSVSFLESTINELHADATDEEYSSVDENARHAPQDDREAVAQYQKLRPGTDVHQVPDHPRHCRPARV